MLIESKSKTGHSSIFSIRQANFENAQLLHKMAKGLIFNPTTVPIYKDASFHLRPCLIDFDEKTGHLESQ